MNHPSPALGREGAAGADTGTGGHGCEEPHASNRSTS